MSGPHLSGAENLSGTGATSANSAPWEWEESTWRSIAEQVRAGRSFRKLPWRDNAEVAVALSFDADHETPWLRDAETGPAAMAMGEYGARVGVPRILALLAQHSIPSTFFVPAVSALLHPGEVPSYIDAGHEVALHGWIHERNTLVSGKVERELYMRAADTLERLGGQRPVGIRTPSWDFSSHTIQIIRDMGLRYDSSLMADDEPYELLQRGTPTGVVEIPVDWIRDDGAYFVMDRFASLRPYISPREVLQIWRAEYHAARAAGGLFQLTLHPDLIGHRSRMMVLSELLAEIASDGRVWFATHAQIADHCLASPD